MINPLSLTQNIHHLNSESVPINNKNSTSVWAEENISFEDLVFLANDEHALGFRHAGDRESAAKQLQHGFFGDSLNLDVADPHVWEYLRPDEKPDDIGFTERNYVSFWPEKILDDTKKELLVLWQKGVQSFFEIWAQNNAVFFLIDYGKGGKYGAYDIEYYFGLGKMGKKEVLPNKIVAVIYPPDTLLQKDQLILYYRSSLIKAVREYAIKCKS